MTGKVNVNETEESKDLALPQVPGATEAPADFLPSLDDEATRASVEHLMKRRVGPGAELHPEDAN